MSAGSDFDLEAIHVAPTSRLVGLHPDAGNAERMEVIAHDGANVEIDDASNELGARGADPARARDDLEAASTATTSGSPAASGARSRSFDASTSDGTLGS